ncbi:MAG: NAD(P)/FAD-dependent oxidoreductase [Armatimonadetes bacterium]|nr:NAD(P)/FAD-dependent oxidoreductase [Armatimonadota bacterium]
MSSPARVLILGAGFGGLSAAKALRRRRDVEVTIVDHTNHHLFQPLLYQVATAGLNPSEIASPVRAILRRQKNLVSLMGQVTAVDYASRTVELDHGIQRLEYDFLILALGGKTSYFGNDRWASVAPGLKSLRDALEIRQRVLLSFERAERADDPELRQRLMTIVAVGGGPTGVELAGAMAELRYHVLRWDFDRIKPEQARVILIEGGDRLLGMFPERLSEYASRRLEKLGVEIFLNERVTDISSGVVTTSSQTIHAENIFWAAGVAGHDLAPQLGEKRDRAGRLHVEADLRLPGHDRVYCIGDMARFEHPGTHDGKPLPGLAPVAMQQGTHAARNIIHQLEGRPTRSFHYVDKGSMATIGRSAAVAMAPFNLRMTGFPAWLAWLFVHLMYIVDHQNRILVLLRWAWAYFTWKWGVRLITWEFTPAQTPAEADQSPADPETGRRL